jgi:hypothetical protein
METDDPVNILTNYLALSVIADDRWPEESDSFGISVFAFLLYGFARKTCEELDLPLSKASDAVTAVLSDHADCSDEWISSFLNEAEQSANDVNHHPGHHCLIETGRAYEASDDMSEVVENVYTNLCSHRLSAETQGKTANEWTSEDFQAQDPLILRGAPEFIQFCISRGNCEFDQELIAMFQEIVGKYSFIESDDDQIDPPEQFAVFVRDGLIDAGLIPKGDPARYQYKLSMAFIHYA